MILGDMRHPSISSVPSYLFVWYVERIFNKVVLPEPDWPRIIDNSNCLNSPLMSFKIIFLSVTDNKKLNPCKIKRFFYTFFWFFITSFEVLTNLIRNIFKTYVPSVEVTHTRLSSLNWLKQSMNFFCSNRSAKKLKRENLLRKRAICVR